MSNQIHQQPSPQTTATGDSTMSLVPLRADGALALDTSGIVPLDNTTLCALTATFDDASHTTITRTAADLFRTAALSGKETIPACGYLTRATFFVQGPHGEPQLVEIRIPNTLLLAPGTDPAPVHSWLTNHCFKILGKAVLVLLAFAMATICVAAPALDDGDNDEDDDFDSERIIHRVAHFPRRPRNTTPPLGLRHRCSSSSFPDSSSSSSSPSSSFPARRAAAQSEGGQPSTFNLQLQPVQLSTFNFRPAP